MSSCTSVLLHRQQDECMRELCQELARCMARLAFRVRLDQLDPLQEAKDASVAIPLHRPDPL